MKKKFHHAMIVIACWLPYKSFAQNSNVGIGTLTPHPSALLEIASKNQGLLTPRLTTAQRLAIAFPADGLLVYDLTVQCFFYYSGAAAAWVSACPAAMVTGPTGPTGLSGANGYTGPTGATGLNGITGPTGVAGIVGPTGPTGANGSTGATGNAGPIGATGVAGATGNTGATGPAGMNGQNGLDGLDGMDGPPGPTGPAGSPNAWYRNGNTGNIIGTNFLGNIDNVDLQFRVNNVQAGIIENNDNLSTGIGYNTLVNETPNHFNSSVAVGYEAMLHNTSGTANVGVGFRALLANTSGLVNTAVGSIALFSNTIGSNNTAVGREALGANTTGSTNCGLGSFTLMGNTTGSGNTALGYGADVTVDGLTNVTVIGSYALASQSNTLILGAWGNLGGVPIYTRVGIGTGTPTAMLSVNGAANNATGAWGVFSDKRVKTITGAFTDGLNVIKNIHPVRFMYNKDAPFHAEGEQIGVVAQDLEQIAPYMVSQKDFNNLKGLREVNNQAYIFILINGMQEQQQMIDRLQRRIEILEKTK